MKVSLALALRIDALNEWVGQMVKWLVLAATLISAGNALLRYGLGKGSNAGLELQWYLFGAIFLLGAGYTLKHRGHVRIDLVYAQLSERAQWWVEVFGTLLFLLPFSVFMVVLSWPLFSLAWHSGEMSPDAGGLPRWPVDLLIPVGFTLLALQGVAEMIKALARLAGYQVNEQHETADVDVETMA